MYLEPSTVFSHYRTASQLFLEADLFHIDGALTPKDYFDRSLMPEVLGRCYDALLFDGALLGCALRTVCQFSTPFLVCFSALKLEEGDGYAVLGPYLPDAAGDTGTLEALLARNGLPLSEKDTFRAYLDRLPVLSDGKIVTLFTGLSLQLYGWPAEGFLHMGSPALQFASDPLSEEDATQARADAIASRYARERLFLEAVARGDDGAVQYLGRFTLDRLPNRLRNKKNLHISLNTLLRKAVESASVHPFYIDAISSKWAVRIEGLTAVSQLDDLYYRMILDYCALVRKHALGHYSHHVRGAIHYVGFNFSRPDLSLTVIARSINVNASYLSHQFNKEVGMNLPTFIARQRVAEAQALLRGNRSLSVGDIAGTVGFEDVNYFSQTFKRITGVTPTAYRKAGN